MTLLNLISEATWAFRTTPKSPSLMRLSITLGSYFSGSDLTTCKIALRLVESVLMLISLLFTVPHPVLSTPVIYHDLRHDTWAWTIRRPFISLVNNTCQARFRPEKQGELWGFENAADELQPRSSTKVVPMSILLWPGMLEKKSAHAWRAVTVT